VSNVVLGLDGAGGAGSFADYQQWEEWKRQRAEEKLAAERPAAKSTSAANGGSKKKKLSYMEQREWETIEQRIEEAEAIVHAKHALAEDPAIATDPAKLTAALNAAAEAQEAVDALYVRWGELGAKLA
jgi:ATP-binding cassette subfamily F protein uup